MPKNLRIQFALKEEERTVHNKKPSKRGLWLKKSYLKRDFKIDLLSSVIDGSISEFRERLWKLRSECPSETNDKKNKNYF